MLISSEQTGEVTGPGPGDLPLLLFRERVRADHRDSPPVIEHLLGRSQVQLGARTGERLSKVSLELRTLG